MRKSAQAVTVRISSETVHAYTKIYNKILYIIFRQKSMEDEESHTIYYYRFPTLDNQVSLCYHVIYHVKYQRGCVRMLSNEVYMALREKLLTGELLPGQMINRRDIAEQLGTSTAPVLEAMKQLEFDGYLETIPRRGTLVKTITKEDLIGNYIARIGFECMAIRMCVVAGTLAECANRLRALAQTEAECRTAYGPSFAAWTADSEYHIALVEACGNARLIDEYHRIALPNLFYRQQIGRAHV